MAVLPKYALKLLFEAGDLITQDTLNDLIDATYNPTLVAGSNITLNSVSTPSGTTITISSTGGGSGITLTTQGTSGAATLNAGVLNIPVYSGGGKDITVQDAGTDVTTALSKLNFTGDVTVTGSGTGNEDITIDVQGGGTYTNLTPTPQPFPGNSPFDNIAAGSTFNNQTFTEMMNAMLYPTLDPTLTAPSQTGFTLSPSGFREIGEVFAPGAITLNSSFSRGSISPPYGTNGFRSGLPNAYNYTGPGSVPSPQASTSLSNATATTASYTIILGAQNWTSSVSFDAGEQPKDSAGNNFDSPLAAGTTSTITRTITGVYPVFATTVALGTMTKQNLQSMTTNVTVDVVTESGGGGQKQTIDIPTAWAAITGLQQFNTFSGQFDDILLSSFTTSATTHVIQGNVVNYTRYTHNGTLIGARKLRFKT